MLWGSHGIIRLKYWVRYCCYFTVGRGEKEEGSDIVCLYFQCRLQFIEWRIGIEPLTRSTFLSMIGRVDWLSVGLGRGSGSSPWSSGESRVSRAPWLLKVYREECEEGWESIAPAGSPRRFNGWHPSPWRVWWSGTWVFGSSLTWRSCREGRPHFPPL